MDRLLNSELTSLVNHGREERNLEYKEILDWQDKNARSKVVKTILAMANIRDGGAIVIGVTDDGDPVGIPEGEVSALTHDLVAAEVANYAAPYVEITVSHGRRAETDSAWFVVIEVREFAEVPVICKADGSECRAGAIYTRGRRTVETSEVRSEAEMRELIDIAVDKGVAAFERRARLAGTALQPQPADAQQFAAQRGEL